MRVIPRYLAAVLIAGLALCATVVAAVPQLVSIVTAHESTSSVPPLSPIAERSIMYDAAGQVIGTFRAEENRRPITLDQVPPGVVDAILAVEDANFYLHQGVNLKATLRAVLASASVGDTAQGGSTITQQVVKNRILGGPLRKQEAGAKLKEAMYALRLEKQLTKDQILTEYLNTVYFGNGTYGVATAADLYFGRPLSSLTMADGAFLATLIRDPGYYDPFVNPDRFTSRRKFSLQRLVEVGKMTQEQADQAAVVPPPVRPFVNVEEAKPLTYFAEQAKQVLLDDPTILSSDSQERFDLLFKGGLRIYTTQNPLLQTYAEEAMTALPPEAAGRFTAAIASLDPRNGAVRAIVGGPGFAQSQFDLAVQSNRQVGSTFKTFVLLAALREGIRPDDVISGAKPCEFVNPGQENYAPEGFSKGIETIETQFAKSTNCAFVRLGQAVGVDRVLDVAEQMGIPTDDTWRVPSLPLGVVGVSPFNMASAFGVIANDGVRQEPYYIERVEDRFGNIVYQHEIGAGVRVLESQVAQVATQVMTKVVTSGTASRELRDFGRPAAGKTGTSQDYADAWFVGFTPELTTAVWMGSPRRDDPFTTDLNEARESMRNLGEFETTTGGTYPARIWEAYMTKALAAIPPTEFPVPVPFTEERPPARVYAPGAECFTKYFRQTTGEVILGAAGGGSLEQPQPPNTEPRNTSTTLPVYDPGTGTPMNQPIPTFPANARVLACGNPAPVTTTTLPTDTTPPGGDPGGGATPPDGGDPGAATTVPVTAAP